MNDDGRVLKRGSDGFTLVEILTVIVIIGILAGIAIPAITNALGRAKDTAIKLEVTDLVSAVNQYQTKYDDFPPDGSSWPIMQRHMRKAFPRMAEPDLTLLKDLTHTIPGTPNTFSPVAMDRAEALVFFLGGFSDVKTNPLTGPGGPLEFKDFLGDGDTFVLANYQYNATRNEPFHTFAPNQLDFALVGSRYVSTDESNFGFSGPSLVSRGGVDLLPAYRSAGVQSPYVYFDSRTYGHLGGTIYNGFLIEGSGLGGVRPYKTQIGAQPPDPSATGYATQAEAFAAIPFHNPETFQIISPGRDGIFGAIINNDVASATNGAALPVHFVTETGDAVAPHFGNPSSLATQTQIPEFTTSRIIVINGYQDIDWNSNIDLNGNLDNITDFSKGVLGDELE